MTGSTHPQPDPGQPRRIRRLLAGATALTTAAGLLAVTATSAQADAPAVTWTQQPSGTTQDLHAVTYLWNSTSDAIAVGDHGTVLKTTDGGLTWTASMRAPRRTSTPSAATWTSSTTSAPTSTHLASGRPATRGTIVFSADGGSTWCTQTTGTHGRPARAHAAAHTVTATGAGGAIVQANTDGDTCDAAYAAESSGTTADLNAVTSFSTNQAGYIQTVGSAGAVAEYGNPDWLGVDSGTTQTLYSSALLQSNDCTAFDIALAGAGGFFATDTIDPDTGAPGPFTAESTGTTNDLHAIATTFPSDPGDSVLSDVLAVGDAGTIRYRDSATGTWTAETSPVSADLQGIASQYGSPGLIVGSGGTILSLADTATSTSLAASSGFLRTGEPDTLTATVSGAADPGQVAFTGAGGTAISGCSAVTINAQGKATCTTTWPTTGTKQVTATYTDPGGPDPSSTSSAVNITVIAHQASLSFASAHATIRYGSSDRLYGTLHADGTGYNTSGLRVLVQRRAGPGWLTVATVTTGTGGAFSATVKPAHNTTYRAAYNASSTLLGRTSASRTVHVASSVSIAASSNRIRITATVYFTGLVGPNQHGKQVLLQRSSGGAWHTVKSGTLSSTSHYRIAMRPTTHADYYWRVYRAGTTANAAGTSPKLKVTVL